MPELAVWLTFLLIVPLSALVLWQKERVRALCARKGYALVCGAAGSAGSALFALSAFTGSWAMLVAGAVLASVFMGMAILM